MLLALALDVINVVGHDCRISKHLRSFLPYVVPRLRKNEIWRQLYIQHNYVIYYYICVDVDSQNLFAEQKKKETTTTPLSHDDYYYYAYSEGLS
jgi:hypothetical protein